MWKKETSGVWKEIHLWRKMALKLYRDPCGIESITVSKITSKRDFFHVGGRDKNWTELAALQVQVKSFNGCRLHSIFLMRGPLSIALWVSRESWTTFFPASWNPPNKSFKLQTTQTEMTSPKRNALSFCQSKTARSTFYSFSSLPFFIPAWI